MRAPEQRIAAFFDIDRTVLEINSGSRWVDYQWRTGQITFHQLALATKWLFQYHFGYLDYAAMCRRILTSYQGKPVEPIYREFESFFHRHVARSICVEARQRIEEHRRRGHVVALLTSATDFLCRPLASALQVEHVLCTGLEVVDGHLTGRAIDPVCYGAGKVVWAEHFAAEHGIDLERSFFYSDSVSDLPMLERVGQPRVINPDPRLRRKALARGWSFEIWKAPGEAMGRA